MIILSKSTNYEYSSMYHAHLRINSLFNCLLKSASLICLTNFKNSTFLSLLTSLRNNSNCLARYPTNFVSLFPKYFFGGNDFLLSFSFSFYNME